MLSKSIQVHALEEHQREKSVTFIQKANAFSCKLTIAGGDFTVNAKSLMSVLSIGLYSGQVLELQADGSDEEAAMESLVAFLEQ